MGKSILEIDFSVEEKQMEVWYKKRETKVKIYQSFSQCILYLQNLLECESDSFERYLIEKEIKKLKKRQQNYRVPSIMEMAIYSPTSESQEGKSQTGIFGFMKKMKK